jgi:L,D-transpeptidase ErfK/SrfK
MRRAAVLLVLVLGARASAAAAVDTLPVYHLVAGEERDYTVRSGDSIWSITGRFTMSAALLKALNEIATPDRLAPGTHLRVSDRHIVPGRGRDGIVINLADRTLYWFMKGALHARFPVGIGRNGWATPAGHYRIVGRREDPIWHVPPSIQAEMRAQGGEVVTTVAAGPDNPLGKYWIQLSTPGYGLHGTNAPASIGKYATHGCLRLLPDHVERLFREAPDGTRVDVIHEPVKIAVDTSGRVLLEVHPDAYHGNRVDRDRIRSGIETARLGESVDWDRVDEAIARAWGIPEDVTRQATPTEILAPAGAGMVQGIAPIP